MYQKWMKILSACALFQGIETNELNTMLTCLQPVVNNYKKNEIITIEGGKFAGVGVILSGEVAVTKESAVGNRIIIAVLKPGEMFGEMAAFSGRVRVWPATVTAQENCTVMFISPDIIVGRCQKLCTGHRLLATNMLKIISDKALMLNRKVEYLAMKSMRGKISSFLIEQYKRTGNTTFMLPMKRNELADFLNVSRPSLSREMCRMRDEGIIEFHRASIRIRDVKALKQMIE